MLNKKQLADILKHFCIAKTRMNLLTDNVDPREGGDVSILLMMYINKTSYFL